MRNSKVLIFETIFSFFIIISIISIITFVCLKINSESKSLNNNAEATIISTNILENINSRRYNKIEEYIEELSVVGVSKKIEKNEQLIIVDGSNFVGKFFGTDIPEGYKVELSFKNLDENIDIQKSINIKIKYNEIEVFNLDTVLQHENVDVCNKPIITNEYFEPIGINLDEYEIIPIKYSYKSNSYVTTTKGDNSWYNYYAKEWAKVLIFPNYGEDLKSLFIDNEGNVKNQIQYNEYVLDLKNYIYVWIPNFSMRDNISYFRYNNGKNAIRQELIYDNGEYLYINSIGDSIPDITEDCNFNGISGVWRKLDNKDIYFSSFNSTRFGPLNLH